jgi:heme exporter protein CcmD
MIEFLNMGGYALFVWGAYAIATLLVSVLYISSVKALKAVQSTSEVSVKTKEATGTLREKSLA